MRNDALRTFHDPCTLGSISAIFLGASLLLFVSSIAIAQVVTNITPTPGGGHLGTMIVPEGANIYNIQGGTTKGSNLFHSFGEFSVGAADIARFQTTTLTSDLSVSNILGRVTGGNPSNIFGTIDSVTFYPNANLFLMNPAGIVFGPNATLNVGGAVNFTTADYLRLEDNAQFMAIPGPDDALLTAFPVAAFGFLGPNAASIAIQGSTLQVAEGQVFTLVGGNRPFVTGNGDEVGSGVTMTGGTLVAPSGGIQIASVDSAGEVVIRTAAGNATFNAESFATLGNIAFTEGALLSVSTLLDPDFFPLSENGNGIVRIRGGQLMMDSATVEAHNFGLLNGEPTAIDVDVRGDMTMNNASLQAVTLDATGGNVMVNAGSLSLMDSNITASSFLAGAGGAINVSTANALTVDSSFIGSFAEDTGSGGPITLSAGTASMTNSGRIESRAFGTATPGDVTLEVAGDVSLTAGASIVASTVNGTSGNISIAAGGDVTVSGQLDALTPSQIFSGAPSAFDNSGAGNIDITAKNFFLTDRALVDSISLTQPGGNITIRANESVVVSGTRSRILMRVSRDPGGVVDISAPTIDIENNGSVRTRTIGEGAAGDIRLAGDNITIANGQVTADSLSLGRAGKISLIATDTLLLSGRFTDEVGQTSPAGVFSEALSNGDGGPISIRAVEVEITSGSTVSAKSTGSGAAGSITIQGTASPAESILVNGPGSSILTETSNTGAGGAITTWSNELELTNGATISAKTTGQMPGAGNAGNILIKADDITISGGATITAASTGKGNAGTVTIQGTNSPSQSLLITGAGSGLFSNTSGTGTGGDILVVADEMELTNGGTLSAKTTGTASTATGGTITVRGDDVRVESGGTMTASSSGPGKAGNILIEGTASPAESIRIDDSGSGLFTETSGTGAGGDITTWSEQLRLTNGSTISAKTTGQMPNAGDGGNILIKADDITISGGATITAASTGTGNAGTVTIQGAHSPARSLLITGAGSGVFSDTSGTGAGGDLLVISESVRLADGGTLSAATSGTDASAVGGTIGILAENVRIENGVLTASSTGQGEGGSIGVLAAGTFESHAGTISTAASRADAGDIGIFAGQSVTLNTGTSISTRSTGPGHAGDIFIDAGQLFEMHHSAVTAEAAQAAGGSIDIRALDRVKLEQSLISTSVLGGAGSGGNIFIDPNLTTLKASQILAQAVLGNGGNITLVTRLFFADPFSRIDASSQFGLNGLVQIQSPTSNLAGTLGTLPSSLRQTPNLQTGRCAALANSQSSSFLIAGRDAIPTEPGGWQPSPLAVGGDGIGLAARGAGTERLAMAPSPATDGDTVSLRRLTPAGFLTQSFAEGESTGCRA